jgi:hypothetical protein
LIEAVAGRRRGKSEIAQIAKHRLGGGRPPGVFQRKGFVKYDIPLLLSLGHAEKWNFRGHVSRESTLSPPQNGGSILASTTDDEHLQALRQPAKFDRLAWIFSQFGWLLRIVCGSSRLTIRQRQQQVCSSPTRSVAFVQ